MYGWRARLGLLVPASNTTNEPEFYSSLPDGISLHTTRMKSGKTDEEGLEYMNEDIERSSEVLARADVDVAIYGCTTGSLVGGPGFDEEITSTVSDITGVPSVATASAITDAFDALDVSAFAIATPYISELNEREREFLEESGYTVCDMSGLGLEENQEIGSRWPQETYRRARQIDTDDADAVFVSCTNYRTFDVIDTLERDLNKPVVTSNQATLWKALRTVDIDDRLPLGELFSV